MRSWIHGWRRKGWKNRFGIPGERSRPLGRARQAIYEILDEG
jgi:hypothetical protein